MTMWCMLTNGEVSTVIESFCLTFRADRYIRYMIKRRKGDAILLSGSAENVGAAVSAAIQSLRQLMPGLCMASRGRAEALLDIIAISPLPLTNTRKHVTESV